MKQAPRPKLIRSPAYRLAANPECLELLTNARLCDAAGFDTGLRSARERPAGRGPQRIVDLPGADSPLRLRERRRGGALGGLLANRFPSPRRVERELTLWLGLHVRGAPLPLPVGAFSRRRGLLWESHLGALDRSASQDGLAWLGSSPARRVREQVASAFGDALRRLHDAGALHGDLNLRNVLIESGPNGTRCLFVDLASARAIVDPTPRERISDALRLERSLAKRDLLEVLDPRLRARALAAYCRGDRRLRAALLAAWPDGERQLFRHRLAWRLARLRARGARTACAPLFGLVLGVAFLAGLGAVCEDRPRPDAPTAISFGAPPWHFLSHPIGQSREARFSVDRTGRVESLTPGRDASRPAS